MRREEQGRRPGVVHQHDQVARMRHRCDRRNVLHLEGERAGRLGEHRTRIRLEQARDVCAEQRIVVGRLDAEFLQHAVAEIPRRPVDRVRYQQVIAGLQAGEQRNRDRRKPGGHQHGAGSAGKFGPGDLERVGGRCSLGAVGVLGVALEEFLDVGIQHCRSAIDRRIHKTVLLGGHPAGGHEPRGGCKRLCRTAAATFVLGYPVHLC